MRIRSSADTAERWDRAVAGTGTIDLERIRYVVASERRKPDLKRNREPILADLAVA